MRPSVWRIWVPLAVRFILRHRRKTLATGSFILVGTAVLVLLHGITVGINDTMVLNTTALHYGHAYLEVPPGGPDPELIVRKISENEFVNAVLLRYRFASLVRKGGASVPVIFYAVKPGEESTRTAIAKRITEGAYPSGGKKEVLLGSRIAEELGVKPGDKVSIIESSGRFLKGFTVSGIYRTEIDRFDRGISFLPADALEGDLKRVLPTELAVFYKPGTDTKAATKQLNRGMPGGLVVKSWDRLMPDLVQLIELNEVSMKLIMVLVFLLVGFGISNTFILTIVERFREFGILKAMGTTPGELVLLIFLESFMVCATATVAGLALGWLLTGITAHYGIDLSSFTSHNRYFVMSGIVRPRMTFAGLYWPFVMALVVSLVSSYLPARVAARKITAETLRFA